MANLLEDIQCAGSDTRPPMLDRIDFASWEQRIRLNCQGKKNGVNILKSIDEGPYQMGIVREPLLKAQKEPPIWVQNDHESTLTCLLKKKIDIWDNVKMLLEGSELTKEDRESQLYNDFEHFRQHKGESIHDYYFRFAKLINDMRNIKMTMSRMQLNSKFVNNMLPEWGRFVTVVKLNRGLRDSNYDQLAHSKELHSTKVTTELQILQRQYVVDAGSREQSNFGRRKADDCDAFDSDVDETLTAQTMFMANLSSADPVTNEAGPSYDSDILSEVQDHDHYQDVVCAHCWE
nr:hypothetical protein [Tanacetum cinerariifolium]